MWSYLLESIWVILFIFSFIKGSVEAQCGLVLNGQGGVIRRGKWHVKTKHSSLIWYFVLKIWWCFKYQIPCLMIKKTITLGWLLLSYTGILLSFIEAWTQPVPQRTMIEEICCSSWNSDRIKVGGRGRRKRKKKRKGKNPCHTSFPHHHILKQNFWSLLALNVPATAWVIEVMVLAWGFEGFYERLDSLRLQRRLMKHQYCSCPYFSKCPEHFFL